MSIETIKDELRSHLVDMVSEGYINEDNFEAAHHYAFNEDYYIIGYYKAEQWLKKHNMSAFEAIRIVITYEVDTFGEYRIYDNAEKTVNMLVYVIGEDVTPYADTWEEFKSELDIE